MFGRKENENTDVSAEKASEEANFGILTAAEAEETLRQKSQPITAEKAEEIDLWNRLVEATLKTPNGIGLAAIQIGLPYTAAVLVDRRGEQPIIHKLLNPKIIKAKKPKVCDESCLSVPGKAYRTRRCMYVLIENDLEDEPTEYRNIWAQSLQHEIGHFNGELVYDVAIDQNSRLGAVTNRIEKSRKKRAKQKQSRRKNRRKK